ncbi:MAG: asparagine synthetase B [Spirochaetaceae bacterium]|nr:MAG: asparagine synthetase B [Spirochaetaceae bacterium]
MVSGICGIVNLDGAPVDRPELERMAQRAAYRGRDGIRYQVDGAVGMAHLLLQTLPQADMHPQHLVAAERRVVFAADARLDNRDECAGADCPDAAPSDAELMLAVMLRYPDRGPERLLGDFACALWDGRSRRLRLARDAMGMRSLYYRVEPRRILFATELKQILAADGVPRQLSEQAVAWHLAGMQTPPGIVFYQGIDEVRPAEEVVFDAEGRTSSRIFWRPDPAHRIRYRGEQDYAEHLRHLLLEAMRCRLRARSPVGVSLSGGMDSASLASVAGWLRERGEDLPAMRAYSWAFHELVECDERENVYRVANRYAIPVTEIPAEQTWPLVDYPQHGPHQDDPFFGMYQAFIERALSLAAADGVTVMFYGDRGDLMCGGDVADVTGMLLAARFGAARAELVRLSQLTGLPRFATIKRYLIRPLIAQSTARRRRLLHVLSPLAIRVAVWTERTCAAFGTAYADPWSDRRIAEFVLAAPQHLLHRAVEPKRLARRAMKGIMPVQAIRLAAKIAPGPLYERALREQAYRTVVDLLTDSRAAELGFIDETALRARFERFVRGEERIFDLWSTLTLETWLRRYW